MILDFVERNLLVEVEDPRAKWALTYRAGYGYGRVDLALRGMRCSLTEGG